MQRCVSHRRPKSKKYKHKIDNGYHAVVHEFVVFMKFEVLDLKLDPIHPSRNFKIGKNTYDNIKLMARLKSNKKNVAKTWTRLKKSIDLHFQIT